MCMVLVIARHSLGSREGRALSSEEAAIIDACSRAACSVQRAATQPAPALALSQPHGGRTLELRHGRANDCLSTLPCPALSMFLTATRAPQVSDIFFNIFLPDAAHHRARQTTIAVRRRV